MSDTRPFHHGNLRAALLEQAETVLRERGLDALSLRDLARDAGVSHGAPRKHFADRSALLDALAERGFLRLSEVLREAASRAQEGFREVLRETASAYIEFAVKESALLDLMFAAKVDSPSEAVRSAADQQVETLIDIWSAGIPAGAYDAGDLERLLLVFSATVQGIGMLVVSRRITPAHSADLIDDAIALFLAGAGTQSWSRFSDEHPRRTWQSWKKGDTP